MKERLKELYNPGHNGMYYACSLGYIEGCADMNDLDGIKKTLKLMHEVEKEWEDERLEKMEG